MRQCKICHTSQKLKNFYRDDQFQDICIKCYGEKPLQPNMRKCRICLEFKTLDNFYDMAEFRRVCKGCYEKELNRRQTIEITPKRIKKVLKKKKNKNKKIRGIPYVVSYTRRNEILKSMGFDSYEKYLESNIWLGIKTKVFLQKGNVCICCKNPTTILHHRMYDENTLNGLSIEMIVPICNNCHKFIEFKKDGTKEYNSMLIDQKLLGMINKTLIS